MTSVASKSKKNIAKRSKKGMRATQTGLSWEEMYGSDNEIAVSNPPFSVGESSSAAQNPTVQTKELKEVKEELGKVMNILNTILPLVREAVVLGKRKVEQIEHGDDSDDSEDSEDSEDEPSQAPEWISHECESSCGKYDYTQRCYKIGTGKRDWTYECTCPHHYHRNKEPVKIKKACKHVKAWKP